MNDNNYLSPFCVNCIKISIILFLARFFTVYDVFVTNHFVNTLFDVAQYTMLLVLIIANPEIAIMREKLKNTILLTIESSNNNYLRDKFYKISVKLVQ